MNYQSKNKDIVMELSSGQSKREEKAGSRLLNSSQSLDKLKVHHERKISKAIGKDQFPS